MLRSTRTGRLIAAWRARRQWSLRILEDKSGVYKSSIQRMEVGIQEPRAAEVERIATALGLTLVEFYGLDEVSDVREAV